MEANTLEKYPRSPYDSESAYMVVYEEGDRSVERLEQLTIVNDKVQIHTVNEGDTLPGISNAMYGDPGLWDRIGLANDIINPFDETEFYPGLNLIIPDINNIIYY